MKTLARADDAQEIRDRLVRVTPADGARWGTMTVREMVCRLRDMRIHHLRQLGRQVQLRRAKK